MLLLAAGGGVGWSVEDTPRSTVLSIDAATTVRTFNPRRLGGSNLAAWYHAAGFNHPENRRLVAELHCGYLRLPGGSYANGYFWNGNGIRRPDGTVDADKLGPDGYPAIDYSAYAPSVLMDTKSYDIPPLKTKVYKPNSNGWHGNCDVKTMHDFILAMPECEPMPCPNAGTGRPVDAAEWVKWAKKQGYGAKIWEIGNELGGAWELGSFLPDGSSLTPEEYVRRYRAIATAMRAVDPTIKIGGGAFAKEMVRDCGDLVDFVSIHDYPGSVLKSEEQMLADIGPQLKTQTDQARGWIREFQPQRESQIEINYSEWNLAGGVNGRDLYGGLWAAVYLSELARHGVDMATQWDAFNTLVSGDGREFLRLGQYYAFLLWNRGMGNRMIPLSAADAGIHAFASRTDDAVSLLLVNPDRDRELRADLRIAGFTAGPMGEMALVSNREYLWDEASKRPTWNLEPRIIPFPLGPIPSVTLPPYSMACVRIPAPGKSPSLGLGAPTKPAPPAVPAQTRLDFTLPNEMYVGDQTKGRLIATVAGSGQPQALAPAALSATGVAATLDRSTVRLSEAVGYFAFTPTAAGTLTLTATVDGITAAKAITILPSVPRPMVFWDFTTPAATVGEHFNSDFDLLPDVNQRANRAVARINITPKTFPKEHNEQWVLMFRKFPDKDRLRKENIRGAIMEVKIDKNLVCEDPDAHLLVTMQSPANWWMQLGTIPLKPGTDWQKFEFPVKEEDLKALPSAFNLNLVIRSKKPITGSLFVDHVGFLVR